MTRLSRSFLPCMLVGLLGSAPGGFAQEILHVEGFNDDGEKANPPRYTTLGREAFDVPRIQSELGLMDQLGPIYWAHNFEVPIVGVPGATAGRRALLAWAGATTDDQVSPQFWTLFTSTVSWLVNNKANATVIFSPNAAAAQSLADRLSGAGYTVVDDEQAEAEASIAGDLVIKGPGNSNPSRWAQTARPVLVFSALDHDDMLTSSIGDTPTFEAGQGTIVTAGHPAAGGLTGSFPVASGSQQWQLMGSILPVGSTTIASFSRSIPPSAATLADVDAMAAGTKPSTRASETTVELDYSDGSSGDWFTDQAVPGGATGVWGLVARGRLNVTAAGRYSFALGMDDGARLRIDLNRNGLGPEDNVINEDAAGGHRARYGDVTFAAAGVYEFEVASFNSGGGGGLEMSVSLQGNGGDTSAISSGSWELLGANSGNVRLQGTIAVTSYVPTGDPEVQTLPLLVLLNGPTDTPPGNVFGGGAFAGFEGTGFFGMSGGNKWPFPDGRSDRTLTLRPVNVTGKSNVRLTVALAATFLDFETSDFLEIYAHPQGIGGPEVRLARYSAPDGASKYFVDVQNGNLHRLGLTFQDVTYDVPAGATQLVIEFRAFSSWWNEILAFDDVRITAGEAAAPILITSPKVVGDEVQLAWTGGRAPFLVESTTALGSGWNTAVTTSERSVTLPRRGSAEFFRVQSVPAP